MLLGSSDVVKWVITLWKMVVKMLTHLHMVVYTGGVDTFTKEKKLEKFWRNLSWKREVMVLGLEFYFDPLCFGSNMHVGCVALCISFPKCSRSSKSEIGAKSYSHFSAQDSGSRLGPVLGSGPCHLGPAPGSKPCHLGPELGSRPCFLGPVERFYICLKGQDPEMVRL
jgi:hypothetical protein